MKNYSFLIITEKGYLEKQSLLLVWSIRNFAGFFSNCNIYSFAPRKGKKPSKRTVRKLKEMGVEYVDLDLNTKFDKYGFGNKPFVCSYAEKEIVSEFFIFLDSDQIVINEPDSFILKDESIGLTPVERKNIGTTSKPSDKYFDYWQTIFSLFNISVDKTIRTTVDDEEICPYYNAGLIVAERNSKLFSKWESVFIELMERKLIPGEITFMDQISLSATILMGNYKLRQFPMKYNYPLPWHNVLKESIRNIEDLVTIHYHKEFASNRDTHPLDVFNSSSNQLKRVKGYLHKIDIYPISSVKSFYRIIRSIINT